MPGQPGHKIRPRARLPPSLLDIDAWMTPQIKVALIRKLRESLMCFAYIFEMLSMGVLLYNQAVTDVRSTGAGIKCLQCKITAIS